MDVQQDIAHCEQCHFDNNMYHDCPRIKMDFGGKQVAALALIGLVSIVATTVYIVILLLRSIF